MDFIKDKCCGNDDAVNPVAAGGGAIAGSPAELGPAELPEDPALLKTELSHVVEKLLVD